MFVVSRKDEMINKTFRFPAELMEKLEKIAARNRISVNALLRQMAEYAIEEMADEKDKDGDI
jgi:predicted DNA-binding protein